MVLNDKLWHFVTFCQWIVLHQKQHDRNSWLSDRNSVEFPFNFLPLALAGSRQRHWLGAFQPSSLSFLHAVSHSRRLSGQSSGHGRVGQGRGRGCRYLLYFRVYLLKSLLLLWPLLERRGAEGRQTRRLAEESRRHQNPRMTQLRRCQTLARGQNLSRSVITFSLWGNMKWLLKLGRQYHSARHC